MNKKGVIIVTAVITAICTFIVTTTFYLTPLGNFAYSYVASGLHKTNMLKFAQIQALLDTNYMGEYDKSKMMDNAMMAYVATVGDPYTAYLNKGTYQAMQQSIEGDYRGIGIQITVKDGKILITDVLEGSPAEKAGICPNDFLVSVGGKEYNADTAEEATAAIKKGTEAVKIGLMRDGVPLEVSVKCEELDVPNVTGSMLENSVGYIRIKNFGSEIADDFKTTLEDLKGKGMQSLVIDLRSNPGGVLEAATGVADLLVPKGIITTVKNKDGRSTEYKSDEKELDMPMCVLINEDSASASEVVAGALRDYKKATLIGKKSFGKGVVQSVYEFPDASALKITVAKYYTPSGECIQGTGIKPDIEVDLPENVSLGGFSDRVENDTQLAKALEILSKK